MFGQAQQETQQPGHSDRDATQRLAAVADLAMNLEIARVYLHRSELCNLLLCARARASGPRTSGLQDFCVLRICLKPMRSVAPSAARLKVPGSGTGVKVKL